MRLSSDIDDADLLRIMRPHHVTAPCAPHPTSNHFPVVCRTFEVNWTIGKVSHLKWCCFFCLQKTESINYKLSGYIFVLFKKLDRKAKLFEIR